MLNFIERIGFSSILSHSILKELEYTSYYMSCEINNDVKTKSIIAALVKNKGQKAGRYSMGEVSCYTQLRAKVTFLEPV